MRNLLFTISLMMVHTTTAFAQTETDDTTIISFANPETEAAVRNRLVRTYKLVELADESVPITVGQAAKIENLDLNIQNGQNPLDGLEKLTNLTWLEINCYTEADLVIPEGLGKLTALNVITLGDDPTPISLKIESHLPTLEWLRIDYSLESIYLDAAAMPALENLFIVDFDYGYSNGWIVGNNKFKTLEVKNNFPQNTKVHIHDSEFIENYDSLMKACRNVTGFHLQYLGNRKENPDAMETIYDLDFGEFSNLSSLSVSSRRVGRIQFPEMTENLTNLCLGYVSNTSINISDPKSGLNRISILESQINEILIHPAIKLDHVDLSTSTIDKLIMTTPRYTHLHEIQVKEIRIAPRLTITDSSVSYSTLSGHHQLLESQDMINWKPIHTSPDHTGELRRYSYRKGIPKNAPQSFYKMIKVNP